MDTPTPTKKQSLDDYNIIDSCLGRGSYGVVFLAENKISKQKFAIKMIDSRKLKRNQREHELKIEKETLILLKNQLNPHPGVIQLKSAFRDSEGKFYFVLEYAEGGSLNNYIRLFKNKLNYQVIQFYITELLSILSFIHSKGIIHRDVKPENLVLTSTRHLKLIDFATANLFTHQYLTEQQYKAFEDIKSIRGQQQTLQQTEEENKQDAIDVGERIRQSSFVGTPEYLSPELIEKSICIPASDLWAVGCVCYKMFHQETPFKNNDPQQIESNILTSPIKFANNIPAPALDLMKNLLQKDPYKRIGVQSDGNIDYDVIMKHDFFKGMDLKLIWNNQAPEIEIFTPDSVHQQYQIKENKTQNNCAQKDMENSFRNSLQMEGQVEKQPQYFWQIYLTRIMKLACVNKKTSLTYYNPKSKIERQINLSQPIQCQLVKEDQFFINQSDNTKYYFKVKQEPTATQWVQKINQAIAINSQALQN